MARNAELEAAIVADPDSAAAYVVYGDWLQVQGDPRGELIAVQLALETARGERWGQLKRRELELLREHAGELLGLAATLPRGCELDWRRGFIDRMRGDWVGNEYALLVHPSFALVRAVTGVKLPTLRATAPQLLTELAIEHDSLAAMLARPGLRHLGFTKVSNYFAEPEPALVEHSNLVSLAVVGVQLDRYGACAFPQLRSVRASWSRWSRDGHDEHVGQLAFVAGTPQAALHVTLTRGCDLAPLREAGTAARRVDTLRLDDVDMRQLRALQHLVPGLHSLEIRNVFESAEDNVLTRAQLDALPVVDRLAHLGIERRITDPEVATALARSPYARSIESLGFRVFDAATFAGLCRGAFPAVRVLELHAPHCTGAQFRALDAVLPNLEELVVPDYPAQLSDSPIAARIQTLTFRGFDQLILEPEWRRALRRMTALRRVRIVGLDLSLPATIETLAALDVPIEIRR